MNTMKINPLDELPTGSAFFSGLVMLARHEDSVVQVGLTSDQVRELFVYLTKFYAGSPLPLLDWNSEENPTYEPMFGMYRYGSAEDSPLVVMIEMARQVGDSDEDLVPHGYYQLGWEFEECLAILQWADENLFKEHMYLFDKDVLPDPPYFDRFRAEDDES